MQPTFSNSPVTPGLHAAKGDLPMLERVRLVGSLAGPLLELSVEQHFCNRSASHVELVYSFPIPWGAVLLDLEVRLGDKVLTGEVAPRARAQALYESALDDGDAAVLLQQTDDGGCTLNLGNLAPDERCVVKYRFAQLLRFDRGSLRLMLPTVLAPRHGAPLALEPGHKPAPDLLADYPLELELTLDATLSQGRIASPSHPVRVSLGAGGATVGLARKGYLDRDFVLVIDGLAHTSTMVLGADPVQAGQVAVLTSFALPPGTPKMPVSAKLLLDCSSSMAGDSIAAAREAMASCLEQLQAGDRILLSDFGDETHHLSTRWMSPGTAAMTTARRWVMSRRANLGGTQMTRALDSVFRLCGGEAADVLLITDGQIENLGETIEAARRSGHRVFAVGIGAAPVEALLRQLAAATGGACEFVAGGEDVQPAVQRLFARLRSEQIEALRCDWSLSAGQIVWSAPSTSQPPWAGDTVKFLLRFDGQPRGSAVFSWQDSSGRHELTLAVPTQVQTSGALARMAAANACQSLPEAEATALAIRYRLLTPHTHWVMVHQRAAHDKAPQLPGINMVRPMLAAGWGGTGSVVKSASTSYSSLTTPALMRSVLPSIRASSEVSAPSGKGRGAGTGRSNYSAQSVPSVWRSPRPQASSGVEAPRDSDNSAGENEIPAFLRRQTDEPGAGSDPFTPAFQAIQSRAGQGSHITPDGLRSWLWARPADHWPHAMMGLATLGVPRAWCDWLHRLCAPGLESAQIVRVFLMALALRQTPGGSPRVLDIAGKFRRLTTERELERQLQQLGHKFAQAAEIRAAVMSLNDQDWGEPPAARSGEPIAMGSDLSAC